KSAHIRQSMSAKANPYDNAWTESFMGTLKLELVQKDRYETEDQARLKIFEYIEAYYNTQRKHSVIGYLSPSQFENSILTLN
ncbi:MAG: putative transposase, partial [Verrucomicrobiales bacterium]